jgi:HEAT repeat protein
MRYWLFTLVLVIIVGMTGNAQDIKKKPKDDAKAPPPPEVTEIAGKSFKKWHEDIKSKDPSKREVAMKTILNFGPERAYEVVPEIIAQLKKHNKPSPVDLSVRVNGILVLSTVFQFKKEPDEKKVKEAVAIFREAIRDKQAILKIRGLQALPYLGLHARDAMPEVVETIGDFTTWEAREVAIHTLAALVGFDPKSGLGTQQSKAMANLYAGLEDPSYLVRHAALAALVPINFCVSDNEKRTIMQKVLGVLATGGKETDQRVLIQAHVTVINLRRKQFLQPIDNASTELHLVPIVNMVDHADPTVRLNALQGLGRLGPPAKARSLQVVQSAVRDPDLNIGVTAVNTLILMQAFETIQLLKGIKDDKQAHPVLKDVAEDAVVQLEFIQNEQKKEKAEKKGDKKIDKK